MLEDLLSGVEKSRFVLITDAAESCGRHFFMNWVINVAKRCDRVVLVCFERVPEFFLNWLPQDLQEKIIPINGKSTIHYPLKDDTKDLLFEAISNALLKTRGQSAVLIDSLTLHMLLRQPPSTCSTLHKLSTLHGVTQVVAVIHRDVHDTHTCSIVGSIASSVIDIHSLSGSRHTCKIRHCRITGKVFKTTERFSIDYNFHIKDIGPLLPHERPSQSQPLVKSDPMAHLSFNLSLTETEKQARSQVKLPYLLDDSGDSSNNEQPSNARIIYHPDDVDDFDEEDPDDDLNI
ncbi:unnamed protein product [Lymnaea stagnalis]|uniref:Elongator complex protein 5 n=1 Tax=Lymnaea stagnalis TaxID=6523 RepID=A0AAV2IJV6_LYMST